MKKFLITLSLVVVACLSVLGVTSLVKEYEKEDDSYVLAIADLKQQVNVNVENVTELKKTVIEYKTVVEKQTETIKEYETLIVEKDNTIVEKEQEIVTEQQTVVELQEQIVVLEKEIETSSSENEEKTAELESLKAQLATAENKIAELESEIEALKAEKSELEDTNSKLEADNVNKTQVITQTEYLLSEKEKENEQLIININELNQTIVELNVKIELLENALDKDEEKNYLASILVSDVSHYMIQLNENLWVISFNHTSYPGFYVLNTFDYSVTYYEDDDCLFNQFLKLDNGDVLFYSYSSSYWKSVSVYIYNNELVQIEILSDKYKVCSMVQDDENFVVFSTYDGFVLYDINDKTTTLFNTEFKECYEPYKLDTGDIIFIDWAADDNATVLYDANDKNVSLLCDEPLYMPARYIGSVSQGDLYVDENIRYFSLYNGGFALYFLDTKTVEVFHYDSFDRYTALYPYICDNYILICLDESIVVFDVELKDFVKVFEISAYIASYSACVDNIPVSPEYCFRLENGNWLLSSNMQAVLYFDVKNLTITKFDSSNCLTYFVCQNGNILAYSSYANSGLYLFDVTNEIYVKLADGVVSKCTESLSDSGVYVEFEYGLNTIFYSYSTGEITELPSEVVNVA